MPVLSGPFDWQKGLIWDIGFIAAGDQLPAGPDLIHFCPAMVDTGASHTCVSQSVAKELQLEPSGKSEMRTAREIVPVNLYYVQLVIILPAKRGPDGEQIGTMQVFGPISAPEFDPGDQVCKALIGRDIISQGALHMSLDGHYTFSL